MEPPTVLLLFGLGLITDFCWIYAVKATNEAFPFRAAGANMALAALSLGSFWSCVSHNSLAEAAAYIVGCGLGTYLSIKK